MQTFRQKNRPNCPHLKRAYQCKDCYVSNKYNNFPTPGWHQTCDRLFHNCDCKLPQDLIESVKSMLQESIQSYLIPNEYFVSKLNLLQNKPSEIKILMNQQKFDDHVYTIIMQDSNLDRFDKKDRLDLCFRLKLISVKLHAQEWVNISKQDISESEGFSRYKMDIQFLLNPI